ADVLRAEASRHSGQDDPVRRAAARDRRPLEQHAPDAQRASMVESVPQGGALEDDDVSRTMRPNAVLVAALALTSALLVTAQTRSAAIPLQSGDIVIRR